MADSQVPVLWFLTVTLVPSIRGGRSFAPLSKYSFCLDCLTYSLSAISSDSDLEHDGITYEEIGCYTCHQTSACLGKYLQIFLSLF